MHSSRRRTGHSLTVCRSLLLGGLLPGDVCFPGGERLLPGGGGIPACTEADLPPANRITDMSKNITLTTTSLRPVNILLYFSVYLPQMNVQKNCKHMELKERNILELGMTRGGGGEVQDLQAVKTITFQFFRLFRSSYFQTVM